MSQVCDVCGGDCSAANPPVIFCPQRNEPEHITGVALLSENGQLWSLPSPHRHGHLFALAAFKGMDPEPCKQGFTTNRGRFVDRNVGRQLAEAAAQMIRKTPGEELYSEDLW